VLVIELFVKIIPYPMSRADNEAGGKAIKSRFGSQTRFA
jgi:hypothetical protein